MTLESDEIEQLKQQAKINCELGAYFLQRAADISPAISMTWTETTQALPPIGITVLVYDNRVPHLGRYSFARYFPAGWDWSRDRVLHASIHSDETLVIPQWWTLLPSSPDGWIEESNRA
jgi:hypothetical protein